MGIHVFDITIKKRILKTVAAMTIDIHGLAT